MGGASSEGMGFRFRITVRWEIVVVNPGPPMRTTPASHASSSFSTLLSRQNLGSHRYIFYWHNLCAVFWCFFGGSPMQSDAPNICWQFFLRHASGHAAGPLVMTVTVCYWSHGPVESSWVFPWISWWFEDIWSIITLVYQRVSEPKASSFDIRRPSWLGSAIYMKGVLLRIMVLLTISETGRDPARSSKFRSRLCLAMFMRLKHLAEGMENCGAGATFWD